MHRKASLAVVGWIGAAAIVLCSAAPGGALAQAPGLSAVPQGSPLPRVLPASPPSVAPGLAAPPAQHLDQVVPGASVKVIEAETRGVTAYPPGHFANLLAPLTGDVDQGRIEQARLAILAAYREDGYVFTAVSASLESGGRLVFSATEGRIVEVKLDGNIGPAGVQVLRFLNHLTEAPVLDVATLERWLLLAQDVPGVSLRTVLRPSQGDPGALSLVAQVSRRPFSGLATADNRGYKSTGPEQILGSISANSFTEYGEHTDATLFYTARYTELFGQVATELFLGASGLKVKIYAGRGTNDPTGALGALGYHGETTVVGTQISYPLIRSRQQTLNLAAFFDALQSHVDTASSNVTTLASRDNLRVLRLGADYALRDVVLGADRVAVNNASLRLSRGITGFGASRNGDKIAGRVGERVDFTKVSMELSRTQTLFTPFADATVALQVLGAGQYSTDLLPSAEKYFLGGNRLNRGFYSGEVCGDRAMALSIEPQLNTSFVAPGWLGGAEIGTQGYVFYDWGETWESQKADHNSVLESAGLGVRLFLPRDIELDIEGVNRLSRRPQGASSNVSALGHQAIYWRIVARF